jgi:hypothetical protein
MEALAITDEAEGREIWEERTRRASEIAQIGRATDEAMQTNIDRVREQMKLAGAQPKMKDVTLDHVYDFSFAKKVNDELTAQKWDAMKYRYVKK